MHSSSYDSMRRSVKRHVYADPVLGRKDRVRILDIGGADVNGSYRPMFGFAHWEYTSADVAADPSVDVVLDDSGVLPFDDGTFEVVVSGQTFEHVGTFWRLFAEMVRVCTDDGVVIVIAPSTGGIHRYPVDCYRFLPDSFQVLADEHGMALVDCWTDPHGPFHDLVGVFRSPTAVHGSDDPIDDPVDVTLYVPEIDGGLQNDPPDIDVPELELSAGRQRVIAFMKQVQPTVAPRFYLEIGVGEGPSLHQAHCRSVGVDPQPANRYPLRPDQTIVTALSNDFFADERRVAELGPLDLVYIDGMHLLENALADFVHAEELCHPCSVVLIDDVFPNHPQQATRQRSSRHWTGDVWKILAIFKLARPDLILLPIDTFPTGTLVVLGVDPSSRSLRNGFDLVLAEAFRRPDEPPPDILRRRIAIDPADPLLWRALRTVRELREVDDPTAGIERLRRLVAGAFPRTVSAAS